MISKAQLLQTQQAIHQHLTALANGYYVADLYWSKRLDNRLTGTIKEWVPFNTQSIAEEYQRADNAQSIHQIHEAKTMVWLKRLLEGQTPTATDLQNLIELQYLHELFNIPAKQIQHDQSDSQIYIQDVEVSQLFIDYAKAQALIEILEKKSTLHTLQDDNSGFVSDNEKAELTQIDTWLETQANTLAQNNTNEALDAFTPKKPMPGDPRGVMQQAFVREIVLMSELPEDQKPIHHKLYVQLNNDIIQYCVLSPNGRTVIEDEISHNSPDIGSFVIPEVLELNNSDFIQNVLKITSSRGHTQTTSASTKFIKMMQRFPIGRLLYGQPIQDIHHQTQSGTTSEKNKSWLYSQLNFSVTAYWFKNAKDSAQRLYFLCKNMITGDTSFDGGNFVAGALLAIWNATLFLFSPILMVFPVLHGLTSLPFNAIRTLMYNKRMNYNYLKCIDVLDSIKDIALYSMVSYPAWIAAAGLLPSTTYFINIVAIPPAIALFMLGVASEIGTRLFDSCVIGFSELFATPFMQAFSAIASNVFLGFSLAAIIGKALYLGYEKIKVWRHGPLPEPLIDNNTRLDYVRQLTRKASDPALEDSERADITTAYKGLLNMRPTQETVDLTKRLLNIEVPIFPQPIFPPVIIPLSEIEDPAHHHPRAPQEEQPQSYLPHYQHSASDSEAGSASASPSADESHLDIENVIHAQLTP